MHPKEKKNKLEPNIFVRREVLRTCVLCQQSTQKPHKLGNKYTAEDVTVHYLCLLLSSKLIPNGEQTEGILGFLLPDIKAEVKRASRLTCCYCKKKGASIGCCGKNGDRFCKRSFHLPCAAERNCRSDFSDISYPSYCDEHNVTPEKKPHKASQKCAICKRFMEIYYPVQPIQSPCCSFKSWYHKRCLMKSASASGYFFKCPLCRCEEPFRQSMQENGIFIPHQDAEWEKTTDTVQQFYGFQQQAERPVTSQRCVASLCKSTQGPEYHDERENAKFSLLFCNFCGSAAVHKACFKGKQFTCDTCDSAQRQNERNNNGS